MEEEKVGVKFVATVIGQKGTCDANHKLGQKFELNCYESGGLCGFFYPPTQKTTAYGRG